MYNQLRIIIILSVICSSCDNTNPKAGLFFNKDFGVILLENSKITHFPNKAPKNVWEKISNGFICNEIEYEGCKINREENNPIIVHVQNVGDQLSLKSDHPCFPHPFFGDSIKLKHVKEVNLIEHNISHLEVSSPKNKGAQVNITPAQIFTIPNSSKINIKSQLWLLFYSGIDYESINISHPFPIEFALVSKDGKRVEKKVNTHPVFLKPLLDYVASDFQKLR